MVKLMIINKEMTKTDLENLIILLHFETLNVHP
jgi:hypothetical protein